MPSLGRLPNPFDPGDALHPMSAVLDVLPPTTLIPASKSWEGNRFRVDQGNVGACVAFTGENWKGHMPIMDVVSNQTALANYYACKKIDPWPNEEGTSDRYLMKVFQQQGRIERYLWAQSMAELKQWILTTGTVMVGTNWYTSMFDPEPFGGSFRLKISGGVAGGHEWLIRRYYKPYDSYKMRNSWGAGWADNGEAWISAADLERLVFGENGDACAAVEKKVA